MKLVTTTILLIGTLGAALATTAAAQAPPRNAGIHYVYLIRHGIYDPDPDRNADDVVKNGLNAMGHEQARLVGSRIAALPIKPASLVTSNYRRARETAEDMGQLLGLTPVVDTLIHECTATSEREDYMRNAAPGEVAACDSNLAAAWAKYMVPAADSTDRTDVLVCHGNVIRWWVSRVLGDTMRWPRMEIGNGSLTILAVRGDGSIKLVAFSDVGHLPVATQTWTGRGAGWGKPPARR